jgi:hypothetical protein
MARSLEMASSLYRILGGTAYMVINHLGSLGEAATLCQWLGPVKSGPEYVAKSARDLANTFASRGAKIVLSEHPAATVFKDRDITIVVATETAKMKYRQLAAVFAMYHLRHEEFRMVPMNLAKDISVRATTQKSMLGYIGNAFGTIPETPDIGPVSRIRVADLWIYVGKE